MLDTVPPAATEPSPLFSCRRCDSGSTVRVSVAGELDIAAVGRLDAALYRAQADGALIVLDLRDLEFIDTSGAHLILAAHHRISRAGGRLVVVRGPAEVDWLLGLMGVDRGLELVDHPPHEDPITIRSASTGRTGSP